MCAKKIGIYGGTFNPIHLGHISLAMQMLEIYQLDEVWFCPAGTSPFKQHSPATDGMHREAMVRLAIKGIRPFKCNTLDLHRPPPSYTVDLLRLLHAEAKQPTKFYLILGKDSADTFFSWHQPEEIIKLSSVVIGNRQNGADFRQWCPETTPQIAAALTGGLTPTWTMDISSTDIRQRILENRHVEHMLPQSVWRYIKKHHLYKK